MTYIRIRFLHLFYFLIVIFLISPLTGRSQKIQGIKIQGVNLKIRDHQADGFIDLPDSLSSGTYLVRASVRTSGIITFKEIFIANRFAVTPETNASLMHSKAFHVVPGSLSTIEIVGIENTYQT